MSAIPDDLVPPLVELLLSVADDKLVLGHRNADWTGLAPILEEDIAFSALAQDEIAHAQALYEFVAPLAGRSADQLAFGRDDEAFRCCALVELPDEFDWATALARRFFCDHLDALRLGRLSRSSHKPLADLAARLSAEEQLHVEHADGWVRRLGAGTRESRGRVQSALDALALYVPGLFEPVEGQESLVAAELYPGDDDAMMAAWNDAVGGTLDAAGLSLTVPEARRRRGGRRGRHTPHLAELLGEMGEVWRVEPGAAW